MIVEAAMLVIRNKDDRILPVRPIANRVHDLRYISLSPLNIGGRMFVILCRPSFQPEIGIYKRHRRQRRKHEYSRSLRQENRNRQKVWIRRTERKEAARLRSIHKIV